LQRGPNEKGAFLDRQGGLGGGVKGVSGLVGGFRGGESSPVSSGEIDRSRGPTVDV